MEKKKDYSNCLQLREIIGFGCLFTSILESDKDKDRAAINLHLCNGGFVLVAVSNQILGNTCVTLWFILCPTNLPYTFPTAFRKLYSYYTALQAYCECRRFEGRSAFQIWSTNTWCSVERGNELLLLTRKWLHWLLYRAVEVCSQGWTVEHDQGLSKSPVADCLELIRSPGSFWQTYCNWIHLLVKDHKG